MSSNSRRRKVSKEDGPKPKKTKTIKLGIAELYDELVEYDGNNTDYHILHDAVWPFLQRCKDQESDEWKKACVLFALLVTNQEGKPSVSDFGDEIPLLERLISTLLFNDSTERADTIHLCILLLTSGSTRNVIQQYLGVELLHFVPRRRLELELKKSGALRRSFSLAREKPKRIWVVQWISGLLDHLEGKTKHGDVFRNDHAPKGVLLYLHRSLELLIDILSAFDTRQFFIIFLDAIHFPVRCKLAIKEVPRTTHRLLQHLLARGLSLLNFPVQSDKTPLSKEQMVSIYHARASIVQKLSHKYYADDLPEVVHAGVGLLCNGKYLPHAFGGLDDHKLLDLLHRLRLVDKDNFVGDREYMMAILMHHLSLPPYPLDELKSFPVYPTETILFDHNVIPPGAFLRKSQVLSIPKLNTQFLSYQDYLLRNFELIRLESAYDIRSDLVDVIKRVQPVVRTTMHDTSSELQLKTDFSGWARMALELGEQVRIMRVTPPKLGEGVPANVVAEITVDMVHCGDSIRREWDSLGEFDNLFLVAIDATKMTGAPAPLMEDQSGDTERRVADDDDPTFPARFGVTAIRGCMVLNIRDADGKIVNDPLLQEGKQSIKGTKRIFRVELDPAQYTYDARSKTGTKVYDTLNLLVRREGRANNFRAVLETIRGLMEGSGSIGRVLPPWLQPVLLGYGDPESAYYKSPTIRAYSLKTPGVPEPEAPLDFCDTFLDAKHLSDSFPDCKVEFTDDGAESQRANLKLEFKGTDIRVSRYDFINSVNGNPVRFTPVQVEAIKAGLSLGLTLVVGPPGTGKSDVAVQIIANLFHTHPSQRTIIITHSNAALNDLFRKIMARGDIDERYMIRLGSGERDLDVDSTHDFSRIGRVSHSLARRDKLLERVQQLSESLGISGKAERGADGSPSYTCESAGYFQTHYVQKHIDQFHKNVKAANDKDVGKLFPFSAFFGLGDGEIENMTMANAELRLDEVARVFAELDEYRPLEILRSQRQRTDYFLMKQAKIVAMTCTHAAIARSRLVEMNFQYDNVVMEEAAQMTEVESFIPLLLQRGETDSTVTVCSRLKRVTMIGDHNQLPPVVKNLAFARFSNLDQSLFARLIGFGVPHVQLNRQGRTRPEIADLFRWRYTDLGDLHHVVDSSEYSTANAGFAHSFQFINVEDYLGKGETTPTAHFYQNHGEAEYAVALFQFMVMIGYSKANIALLTTYNGQKELILDVLKRRCGQGTPFAGLVPKTVSTVDQYQGQQNDYVILSMVRTQSVGYLRDVRRCVVAFSRARLGLYVLGRQSLFETCHELKPMMEQFSKKPDKLQIVPGEHWPATRTVSEHLPMGKAFEVSDVSHLGAMVYAMQEQWIQGS